MSETKQTALDYLNNWRNAQVRITKLEEENERLRYADIEADKILGDGIDKLHAENERLREAACKYIVYHGDELSPMYNKRRDTLAALLEKLDE